jgi:transcriptional regulator with XRE-family HTH domain
VPARALEGYKHVAEPMETRHDGHNRDDQQRRAELARFLRARRESLLPASVGLPAAGRRRTPGLRREELAELAGVGVSWYTWLEQGRPIRVSAQVLESLARALHLHAAETAHLFILARGELPTPPAPATEGVAPAVQQILDALATLPACLPAYVANARWDVVAWNEVARRVFTDVAALPPGERNLLWFIFTHPRARHLYRDWAATARRNLAIFRASTSRYVSEAWLADLVADLGRASAEFAVWWPRTDVLGIPYDAKEIQHPVVGCLALEPTLLQLGQTPDLWMITYTPLPGTDTAARLQRLVGAGGGSRNAG